MNPPAQEKELLQELQSALEAVESVLADEDTNLRLAQVSEQFSYAVRSMVLLRNRIAVDSQVGAALPDSISLDRINALISVMASIEYPLAGIHWPRIRQVRDGLRQMFVQQTSTDSPSGLHA